MWSRPDDALTRLSRALEVARKVDHFGRLGMTFVGVPAVTLVQVNTTGSNTSIRG